MEHGFDVQSCRKWRTVVAGNFEEIEAVREIWEQMQRDESMPVLNADVDRYLAVLESMKDAVQPYIIVLYDDDNPKAVVIGRIERQRVTSRLGYTTILKPSLRCLSVVYGGILGQSSEQTSARLLQEMMDILRRGDVDVVFMNHLRVDSHLYRLSRTSQHFLCRDRFPSAEDHWQTHMPETAEEFYANITRKRKKEWKRLGRRLEEAAGGALRVECYDQVSHLDHFIEVASMISAMTYKTALNAGFDDSSLTRSTLTQAAGRSWWRAYILYAGDVPCAFETGIIYGRTYFAEAIGYNPEWSDFSPGTILFVKVLEDLSRSTQVNIFDYGFGGAAYKERFGTRSWPEASIYIFAPRLYPIFVNATRSFVMGMNQGLGYFANKIGSVGWIKRRWRDLLRKSTSIDTDCG